MHEYYVYILSNFTRTTLYIGMTNDLGRRVHEHKTKRNDGFTARYCVDRLVYWESTTQVEAAIEREKQLKKWTRKKKDWLIETMNPDWNDLSLSF